jgi:hypothetical protein
MLHHIPLEAPVPFPLAAYRIDVPRRKVRWVRSAVVAFAAAASLAGIYGLASATATSIAATYRPPASLGAAHLHAVANAANAAAEEHRAARLICRSIARNRRAGCNAEAAAQEAVALRDARRGNVPFVPNGKPA